MGRNCPMSMMYPFGFLKNVLEQEGRKKKKDKTDIKWQT